MDDCFGEDASSLIAARESKKMAWYHIESNQAVPALALARGQGLLHQSIGLDLLQPPLLSGCFVGIFFGLQPKIG